MLEHIRNTPGPDADPSGRHWLATALGAASMAMLSACASLAPPLDPIAAPVASAWPTPAAAVGAPTAAELSWRDYFSDPALQTLIETALEHNRDLRVAALRTEEARAAFRIQRAQQAPTVGVGVQHFRIGLPDTLQPLAGRTVLEVDVASVGISSWELDLWGRVRSMKAAALEQWLATEQGRRAVELALVAQVADAYLGLREVDERIALARQTVKNQEELERIFEKRLELGRGSRLELMQVRTLLTQGKTLQAQLELSHEQQRNALALLLGSEPQLPPPSAPMDDALVMPELMPGLPSDLLVNRPDILAAEHALRARQANIGAARAAFFPRIALTGGAGSVSPNLSDLFSAGTGAWLFQPTIELPIFDAGMRRANVDLSVVQRNIAIAEYERAIQAAFRDVADALAARQKLTEQLALARQARAEQAERLRLVRTLFDAGSAAHLEVLDAERDLLTAQQQLVQVRRAALSTQIGLYAALGGSTI